MKRRYKCKFEHLESVGNNRFVARVQRLEAHEKLGAPWTDGLRIDYTRTSLIVRIDFEKKEIETLNSVYCY